MRIRKALASDKEAVLEFCKYTFSWGDYIVDVWDRWQSKNGLYVIQDNGEVLGVYNLALYEKEAWIEGMRVHPQYRRKGLGKQMLTHAESISQNKIIRLIIESENCPSIKLVESMGYHLEDKWRLYTALPEKWNSIVEIVTNISQVKDLINSSTYADSWKWLPLDNEELANLIGKKRIVMYTDKGKTLAMAIWNKSRDFPQVFQVGYVTGSKDGITNILRYAQSKSYELNCERIQIFVQEKIPLEANFLDKRSLFYLMKKDAC
jgi:GNAT superfamily N-acetyltransferase